MNRKKICCFTGHRPEKLNYTKEQIKTKLNLYIDEAIASGYNTFISGMAQGSDLWAAEIIIEKKLKNKSLSLICAVPYKGFSSKWNFADKSKYRYILENATSVYYISPIYTPYCFQARNIWMVDQSSLVIAVFNGSNGGTMNTIKYAVKKDITIKNILSGFNSTNMQDTSTN